MTQIKTRQNEDMALNMQYVARCCYNKAEIYNIIAWCLCVISLLLIFIPESASVFATLLLPFAVDVLAYIMVIQFNKNVFRGSRIRASFDDYVFGFCDELCLSQDLREFVLKIITKDTKQAELQKKNTGCDHPAGVKDWYNTNSDETGLDAVFMCQKENVWWDKKMIVRKVVFLLIVTVVSVFALILPFALYDYTSIMRLLLSSALIFRLVERTIENIKYFKIGEKIDGKIELISKEIHKTHIEDLQQTINEKRALNVVGIDFIHKKCAKKLTEIFDKTKV